jgi:DNA polymerase III sliding clamp (beta) subunit (PCNA family)
MTITTQPDTEVVTSTAVVGDRDLRDALSATLLSASKDVGLQPLCAVRVVRTGTTLTLTSTDRFRLTIATVETTEAPGGDDFDLLVSTDDVKRIVAALPKRTARGVSLPVTLTALADSVTVTTYDSTIAVRPVDAAFPNVERIVDGLTDGEVAVFGFNAAYMADLCKMPRARNEPVRVQFQSEVKPLRSTWTFEGVSYLHVLMPLRVRS